MANVFDVTRRKISTHISTQIAPEIFAEKNEQFKEKIREIIDLYFLDPKFKKRIQTLIQYEATHSIQTYFNSKEFKLKCKEAAKGLVR